MDAPKAFISHATEDKERFVEGFYRKLRANGIDAWMDKYEMKPGDSLVSKIFDEGLKEAGFVIVVLSKISLTKPWVKQELNASLVKRIYDNNLKIIPVVIDDCEVPLSLVDTLWVKIPSLDNYDSKLDEIISTIYGHSDKPPLGAPPRYVTNKVNTLAGIGNIETQIFKLACEHALARGSVMAISGPAIFDLAKPLQISKESFIEALEILEEERYIEIFHGLGSHGIIPPFTITEWGFEKYLEANLPNYEQITKSVISQIVNNGQNYSTNIQKAIQQPLIVVNHIVTWLGINNFFIATPDMSGGISILEVKPSLKRRL